RLRRHARRGGGGGRRFGLGQVHAARDPRRARHADQRRGRARRRQPRFARRGRARAAARDERRLRVPVVPAARVAHRARERDAAARARQRRGRRDARQGHSQAGRSWRAPAPLSAPSFRGRAAARRAGARIRGAAQAAARGRAHRQPRRRFRRRGDRAAVRDEPRIRHHARAGHARRGPGEALLAHRAPRGGADRVVRQSLRMLARDWRAGELRVLAMALVIAVAAITSVAFFADRIGQGLARDAHQLLGADLVLIADLPWPREVAQDIERAGTQRAEAINFISMASAKEGTLAGVKAVSENYPLRGRMRIAKGLGQPDAPAERGPAPGTVWLEERLVTALDAPVGSRVKLGRSELTVAAVLTLEPERSTNFFNIAPRLMMNIADVPATALIQTGSRVSYYLYAAGTPQQVKQLEDTIRQKLQRGQRIDNLETGRPEIRSAIDRAQRFLGLTALLAAVLAGVAVALGTRRFVERHLDGCAVMRCLGATQAQLLRLYAVEFLILGLAACAAGCALGYVAQEALAVAVAEVVK